MRTPLGSLRDDGWCVWVYPAHVIKRRDRRVGEAATGRAGECTGGWRAFRGSRQKLGRTAGAQTRRHCRRQGAMHGRMRGPCLDARRPPRPYPETAGADSCRRGGVADACARQLHLRASCCPQLAPRYPLPFLAFRFSPESLNFLTMYSIIRLPSPISPPRPAPARPDPWPRRTKGRTPRSRREPPPSARCRWPPGA